MMRKGFSSIILGALLVLASMSASSTVRGQNLEPWAQQIAQLGPPCGYAPTGINKDGWFTTCAIETIGERIVYWVVLVKRLPDPEAAAREYRQLLSDNSKTWTPFQLPDIDEGIFRESIPKEPGLVRTETTQWHRFRTGVFVVRIRRIESGVVVLPPPHFLPRIAAILKAASPAASARASEDPSHSPPAPPEPPSQTTDPAPQPSSTIEPSNGPSGTAPSGSWLSDPDVRRAAEAAIPAILAGVVTGLGAALANALAGARSGALGQSLSEIIKGAPSDPFKSWMHAGVTQGGAYVQEGNIGYIVRPPRSDGSGGAFQPGRIYGSGTPSDPFRDYPDAKNPPWKAPSGDGTATSPFSNIAPPEQAATIEPNDGVQVTHPPESNAPLPQSAGATAQESAPASAEMPDHAKDPSASNTPRPAEAPAQGDVRTSQHAGSAPMSVTTPEPPAASTITSETPKGGSTLDRALGTIGTIDDKLSTAQDILGKAADHAHDEHKPIIEKASKTLEGVQGIVSRGKEAIEQIGNARDVVSDAQERAGEFKNRLDEVTQGTRDIEMDSRSREAIGVIVTGAEGAGQAMHSAIEHTLGKEAADAVGARDLGKEVSKAAVKTVQDITHQKREITADQEVRDSLDERTPEERADAEEGQRRLDEHLKEKADRAAKQEQDIKSFR